MSIALEQAPFPVRLENGRLTEKETTIYVRVHNVVRRDATVLNMSGETIFTAEARKFLTSWSLRRSLKDASGQHLFDLRHFSTDMRIGKWKIENPAGELLCTLNRQKSSKAGNFASLDANVVFDGQEATLEMWAPDSRALTSYINIGGVTVAEVLHVEENVGFRRKPNLVGGSREAREEVLATLPKKLDRNGWEVRIAPGVDMTLILAMVLCQDEADTWASAKERNGTV